MTDLAEPYIERLQCLECVYELESAVERDGRTAMEFINADGTEITVLRAVLVCPICGEKKKFYSEPLSGVRLGIV